MDFIAARREVGFTPAQKAIYDAVKDYQLLDQRLIALLELQRDGAKAEDVAAVRRWVSDQAARDVAR